MKKLKQEPKPLMAARFRAEARAMLASRTEKGSRFLDAVVVHGAESEPVGRLAG